MTETAEPAAETSVHMPSLEEQIEQLLASLDVRAAKQEDVARAACEIQALGREAIERLARGILRPGGGRREKVAALLGCLTGAPAGWALGELRRLARSRPLNAMEHFWLTATIERLEEAASPRVPSADAPSEKLPGREAASALAAAVAHADEADLLEWRDELAHLTPAEQEAAIASVLASHDPTVLPLLEMALGLGEPSLDAQVADGLAAFGTPAVLPLVRELLRRPDPETRRRARRALAALESHGVSVRDVFIAGADSEEPGGRALATRADTSGQVIVLISRGGGPGRVRYALIGIDPIERGIAHCSGESGLTEHDLLDRINDLSAQTGLDFDPMDLNLAQALVAAAEGYTRRQGRELPSEYPVWRRMIGSPRGAAVLPIVFGPSCTECGTPLRAGDLEKGGIVAGELALCAKCGVRPRGCPSCGRRLDRRFDDFLVQRGKQPGQVEFVCLACGRRARRRPEH